MSQKTAKKPRFITPPNLMKMKVGSGGISENLIEQAQHLIETNTLDFLPYARDYFNAYAAILKTLKPDSGIEAAAAMIAPMMKLKASGGMFQFMLLSDVADIALDFLEKAKVMNADMLDVLKAHEKTLKIIIGSELKGNGGKEGKALTKELHEACKRYYSKHAKTGKT